MEGPESFPKGAVLARWRERKGAPIFATKQSQNQLKEDRFWPLKHGLQQHKGRKEKDTSFLKNLPEKEVLELFEEPYSRGIKKGSLGS